MTAAADALEALKRQRPEWSPWLAVVSEARREASTANWNAAVPADAPLNAALPALAGTTVDGQPYDLADDKGKVLVVNVWGSWCPPCRKEAPELVRAHERLTGEGRDSEVAFVGIDTRDPSRAAAKAYQRKFSVPYPSVYDPSGTLLLGFADSLPPSAIPSTLVIDEQGRVAARVLGGITAATLEDLVQQVRDG